ncbi:MAG TPA: hypothetical protein PL123_08500 [Bacteroidales bacterium]|nr:hypothetical protein [Bacteroidales bacterium]
MTPGKHKTHIICYDDFRWFSEDIKNNFGPAEYTVSTFMNVDEFMQCLEKEKDPDFCRIAVLGAHDTTENFVMIGRLASEIKALNNSTGVVVIGTADKIEEIKKVIPAEGYFCMPKNSNMALRLLNIVKKHEGEYESIIYKRKRNSAVYSLIGLGSLVILLSVLAWIMLPKLF